LRKLLSYGLGVILLVVATAGCRLNDRRLPSLNENYRKTDKQPFGSFVAYNGFKHIFFKRTIEATETPFTETWNDIQSYSSDGVYSLYFLVTQNLVLKSNDVKAMMNYVKAGNDLFISADYVDQKLLDAIYCGMDRSGEIVSEVNAKMNQTHVSMYFGGGFDAAEYGYYYFPFLNSITNLDSSATRILGVNEIDKPNYAVFFSGRGRIYLHVAPRIFSNYFLLTDYNFHYFENVISYLRLNPKNIYWDEYYKNKSSNPNNSDTGKNKNSNNFSSLNVIQKNPSLLWAFWLVLAGMIIYVIFNLKRKQRPIEIIKPNSNASVAFAETVGRLYYQQKNNRHLADKMISYFYEHIRNRYFINTTALNNEFINSLAGKSGVSPIETNELFNLIKNIQEQENISDEELMELNLKIENFNKIIT
jgi:hypothetical protein